MSVESTSDDGAADEYCEGGSNNGTVRPSRVQQRRKPSYGGYTVLTRRMSDSHSTHNSHVVCSLRSTFGTEIFILITAGTFVSPDEKDMGRRCFKTQN